MLPRSEKTGSVVGASLDTGTVTHLPEVAVRGPTQHGAAETPDGISIHWRRWDPPGPAVADVVVVHGGGEHGERYPGLVAELVHRECRVLAPDLRGHGLSTGRRATVRSFSDFLVDLDTVLVGIPPGPAPRFLVGYSLGGVVSARYAIENQRELAGVVVAGAGLAVGRAVGLGFGVANAIARVAPRLPVLKLDPTQLIAATELTDGYRRDPLICHGRFGARMLAETLSGLRSVGRDIDQLRIPLLAIHGADDETADPDGTRLLVERAGSPDKSARYYDGLRHDVFSPPAGRACRADVAEWIAHRAGGAYRDQPMRRMP